MFEKYAAYTVEDFVKDENFITWVKFDRTEDASWWKDFMHAYPHQSDTVHHARQMVLLLSEVSGIQVDEKDVKEIWQGLREAMTQENVPVNTAFPWRQFRWMAAASVIFILGLAWWTYQTDKKSPAGSYARLTDKNKTQLEEVVNSGEKILVVALPDGSKVSLEKSSRLSYSKNFSGRLREVYLSGEAFFEVTKNPEKPFVVYANELVTKVLGTSFRVKAFDQDKNFTVSVKTGKVSVFTNKSATEEDPETRGIILIPNQQVAFEREKETLSRSLVEQPRVLISPQELQRFAFNNAQVSQIFQALEKTYGVDILFDAEVLSACRLTTTLSDETLFERLDVICEAIDATYKVVDAQVIISGKKCN